MTVPVTAPEAVRICPQELGGGQLPLKSDEGQNPAPGASQAVVMDHY